MNFITRFFKESTPKDPVFEQFIQVYEKSIRKSKIVVSILIGVFIGVLIGLLFSTLPNSTSWIIWVCIVNFVILTLIVGFINAFKVKDHVLEQLSQITIFNKQAFAQLQTYLSTQGYITVEQLDIFILYETKQRKIYHNESKKGAKAILEK